MSELNEAFDAYMNAFKDLTTTEKRDEIINSIKEIIATFTQIAAIDNIELHYLKSKEILDLNKGNVSEDDFLEAELVYIEVAKNLIGEYLNKKNI